MQTTGCLNRGETVGAGRRTVSRSRTGKSASAVTEREMSHKHGVGIYCRLSKQQLQHEQHFGPGRESER